MPVNKSAMERRLGIKDPRGLIGDLSAGANVYSGGLPHAQAGGGPQYGRPPMMQPQPGMQPQAPMGPQGNPMSGLIGNVPPMQQAMSSGSQQGMNESILDLIRQLLGGQLGGMGGR